MIKICFFILESRVRVYKKFFKKDSPENSAEIPLLPYPLLQGGDYKK